MSEKGEVELIKRINQNLILKMIREHQPISRAKISKLTHLSRSTVSSIVEDLISKEYIVETGFIPSSKEGGRRAVNLAFNPNAGFGLGVDIGGTKLLMILTNLDGEMIHKEKRPVSKNPEAIIDSIKEFINETNVDKNKIQVMGIGVPAIVDSDNGIIIDSPQLGWQNYHFLSDLKKAFPFPAFINNDVNCAIFGEQWIGSAKDSKDLYFVAIGTGVGSAIILNEKLVEGSNYAAGEIGYFIDIKDIEENKRNKLGSFGTFENKTSGSYLSSHGVSGKELFEKYYNGDVHAAKIIDSFILHLSIGLANVTSLLNPKQIVIGGGVAESMTGIIDLIDKKVAELTPIPVEVKLSLLKGDAGALGSIAYAFKKRYLSESRQLSGKS